MKPRAEVSVVRLTGPVSADALHKADHEEAPLARILNVTKGPLSVQLTSRMWRSVPGSCTTGSMAIQRGNKRFRSAL
jgi:hypothetical protein